MEYQIQFTAQPSATDLQAITNGLNAHSQATLGYFSFKPYGFLIHDPQGQLIAGCTGSLIYGVLSIRFLWVDEALRGKGLGKMLMEKAEEFAKENHCRYINVETFNWQAKTFYEALGYKIEHVYDGYDQDSQFYFFRKKLDL